MTYTPADPPRIEWTVRYLDPDSEEGERLRIVQAAAVRKALQCLRQRSTEHPE